MDILTARPQLLKQANISLIRRVMKNRGNVTRAEIADETKISSTTVRALLTEMMENGEIKSIGYDESSGGRKAERYILNPNRYYGAAFCITDNQIHGLLVNVCGEILETAVLESSDGNYEQAITGYLDEVISKREIRSIGIGVPGVVEGGSFLRKKDIGDELCRVDLGDRLSARYKIPIVMENDLNATAIGFGRCYQNEFPDENPNDTNMAYLHFEKGCISAGFIANGKIIRGSNNFAGEISLVPMEDGRNLEEWIAEPLGEKRYTKLVVQIIGWICGILNPEYVVLGGPDLRKECVGSIEEGLFALLPKNMYAKILYASDLWHDYHEGMAYLTAGKMFDEVQFIKE